MGFLGYSIFLISLFSIQTTILGLFSVANVTPDLALIFALYCGIHFQGNNAITMAGITGFIQDCLSGSLLGINLLSKSLIVFFISNLKTQLLLEYIPTVCFLLIISSFFDGLMFYSISTMLLEEGVPHGFLFPSLPLFAVYNTFIGPFLFLFLNWGRKSFRNKSPFSSPRSL